MRSSSSWAAKATTRSPTSLTLASTVSRSSSCWGRSYQSVPTATATAAMSLPPSAPNGRHTARRRTPHTGGARNVRRARTRLVPPSPRRRQPRPPRTHCTSRAGRATRCSGRSSRSTRSSGPSLPGWSRRSRSGRTRSSRWPSWCPSSRAPTRPPSAWSTGSLAAEAGSATRWAWARRPSSRRSSWTTHRPPSASRTRLGPGRPRRARRRRESTSARWSSSTTRWCSRPPARSTRRLGGAIACRPGHLGRTPSGLARSTHSGAASPPRGP